LSAVAVLRRAGEPVAVDLPQRAGDRAVACVPGVAAWDDAGVVEIAVVDAAPHIGLEGEQAVIVGEGGQVAGSG
jgi:hypothetical protein